MMKDCKLKIEHFKFAICSLQFAVVLALLGLAAPATAQQIKPPKIVGVRVGINDRYKAGVWTQVDVTIRGGSEMLTGDVSVIVPDSDGVPGRSTTPSSRPCQVLPGRDTTVRLITRFGHLDGSLTAEFCIGRDVLARATFVTAMQVDDTHYLQAVEDRELIVVVGNSTIDIDKTGKLRSPKQERWPIAARVGDVKQLPVNWIAYEGVNAVVLLTSNPDVYRELSADNARVQALDDWVRMGGRLVLCVGSQADQVLAADHPLARFAPGRLDKMISLRQTGALETYCTSRAAVTTFSQRRQVMRIPRLADVKGAVEAHESEVPLVVRTVRGLGQVIFLAGDPDMAPLSTWKDRPLLLAKLLDMPAATTEETKEDTAVMHQGYDDLAGQLRSALDRFTGVRLVPFWFVAGLIVVYILLIGPGDYFFLRKVVRRMEWTWVTFPAIIILVSVAAYALAYQLKGDQLRVNQVDLVDVDAASGRTRGTAWMNIFSPRMESFNLTVRPQQPDGEMARDARVWMAWLGLPGGAIGGMNSQAAGPLPWTEQFAYASNQETLLGVPIQVWSTKSLTARWDAPTTAFPAAELGEADQLLSGSITNTLPFELRDCMLAYGRSVYEIGTLAPGEAARLGPMSKRSELKTWLTGWKTVFNDSKSDTTERYHQEATPYDRSSVDVAYILRAMMFYEAAGGQHYSGLLNDYQQFVDLTDLLKADRAILIAQGPSSNGKAVNGATLMRDDRPLVGPQDQHRTLYRFIFPVKKQKDAS